MHCDAWRVSARPAAGVCPVRGDKALVRALVELADTLGADHDPTEHLYVLVDRCVEVLDAAAAGVLLASGPSLGVAAASSQDVRALQAMEAQHRAGPAVEAFQTGEAVSERHLAAHSDRWPQFAPTAVAAGYRCVHAQPLRLRGQRLGAVAVFWSRPEGFAAADEPVVEGLADIASIGIMHERQVAAAHDEIQHLRRALNSRAVVEQAKVLLAERLGVDADAAFDRLRRYARNGNHRLRDVAQRFLDGELDAQQFGSD